MVEAEALPKGTRRGITGLCSYREMLSLLPAPPPPHKLFTLPPVPSDLSWSSHVLIITLGFYIISALKYGLPRGLCLLHQAWVPFPNPKKAGQVQGLNLPPQQAFRQFICLLPLPHFWVGIIPVNLTSSTASSTIQCLLSISMHDTKLDYTS